MKKTFVYTIVAGALFIACKKEKAGVAPPYTADSTASLQYRATFINGAYGTTMGVAKIYLKGTAYSLLLDSFAVSNGPDLHVYLSKEIQPINFIDLGTLRANSGTQLYNINGKPDFMDYKYALIHCQQFNHLFGSANLK